MRNRRVTSQSVQIARRAKVGQRYTEPTTETWDERQARVNAERAAKAEQRRQEAEQEG